MKKLLSLAVALVMALSLAVPAAAAPAAEKPAEAKPTAAAQPAEMPSLPEAADAGPQDA